MIQGKKGGKGGGGHKYHEDPNNLKSVSTAKVLDLISEGEIVGLVNGAKSIYLDDVPLQNADGSYNFTGVSVEMRNGLPDQQFLPGFSNVESFVQVGQEIKYNLPITKRINDDNLDAIVVTMEIPNLSRQNTDNGDMLQYSVQFRVRIRADEGVWQDSGVITIAGKCISSFQRSYYFKVPSSQDGIYDIQVIRVSPDDDSAAKHSVTNWYGYSRIIEAKLNYPNRAICGLTVRADQFGSNVPSRKYEIYGLIVQVPSNYDAWNHRYTSEIWDGTFKRSWTNNPAWVFYDLLTNGRYGLGRDIRPEYIDKYGLYMIGRYCDELVSDGKGGMEPRFTFNGSITSRESAYSVLNNLAGLFNSMIYYSGSVITLVQDSPKTPSRDFSPSNVVDGNFSYEGVARSARHSVFQVTYSNPDDMYNSAIEVVESPEMIQNMGWKSSEITLVGCTSRGQARRRAIRDVYTEQHETETVTFAVGIENADLVPGDIIRISDPSYAGARYGGRIVDIDKGSNKVTLDAETDFSISNNWMFGFILPDNTWMEIPVRAEGITNTVYLTQTPSAYPEIGTVWSAQCDNVEPRLFRVLSIKEDKPYQFTITALLHYDQKYDVIEKGAEFVDGDFTLIPSGQLKAPTNLTAQQYLHRVGNSIVISMNIAWNSGDPRSMNYLVQYKRSDDAVWTELGYTSSETIILNDIYEDTYTIRVQALDSFGRRSNFITITYDAPGYNTIPSDVKELRARISSNFGVVWEWDSIADFDFYQFVLSVSNDSSEIKTTNLSYRSAPYKFLGTLEGSIVAENIGGNRSRTPAKARVTIVAPNPPTIRSARVLDNGIHVDFTGNKGSWDISYHRVTLCNSSADVYITEKTYNIFPVPTVWKLNDTLYVESKDIFDNWGAKSSDTVMVYYYPKTPVIKIGYDKLNGNITLDWNDCRNDIEGAPSIDHYEISGTLGQGNVISVKGTHYEAIIPLTTYEMDKMLVNVRTLSVSVNAVDKYGVTSKDAANYKDNTVSIKIESPFNPTDFGIKASTEGDSLVLNWADCQSTFAIDYYLVTDVSNDTIYKVSTNYVVLPARAEGQYQVAVQAFDVLGQESAIMVYNLVVGGVGGMTVEGKIDGSDILLTWSIPDSSFNVDYYIVMKDNDVIPNIDNVNSFIHDFGNLTTNDLIIPTDDDGNILVDDYTEVSDGIVIETVYGPMYGSGDLVGKSKTNYLRIPGGSAGSAVYYVWAVDVAGNISENYASFTTVTIDKPSAPTLTAGLYENGVGLNWIASLNGSTQLPISTWDVRRYGNDVTAENISSKTPIEDYGRLDVDTTTVPAFEVGKYRFAVRAIDTGGNIGDWGFVDFTAVAPGKVTFNEPLIIDNNAHIYWTQPNFIFFPIKEYLFEEIEYGSNNEEYSMEIGRVDAMFTSQTELAADDYIYGVTPIDMGGNLGKRAVMKCRISQPADFVFFDKIDSLFNGSKTNFVLDGQGHMIGPVVKGETWEQNIARIGNITTHLDKVNAGYDTWLEPYIDTATYTEVINHNTTIPSSYISITPTYTVLKGNPEITCKIETSKDGNDWKLIHENALVVYAADFQYTRFTITVTSGYISFSKILVDLNVKKVSDYGRVECLSTDGGSGMETGTYVPFHVSFTDVQSGPMATASNPDNKAYVNFVDILNPVGFRIYVLDKNGNRVSDTVDWVAYGV